MYVFFECRSLILISYRALFQISPSFSMRLPMVNSLISLAKSAKSSLSTLLMIIPSFSKHISSHISTNVEKICDEIMIVFPRAFRFLFVEVLTISGKAFMEKVCRFGWIALRMYKKCLVLWWGCLRKYFFGVGNRKLL